MKPHFYSTALAAGILALFAFAHDASATTVSIGSQDTTTLPSEDVITTPTSDSGSNFIQSTTLSQPDYQLSPWADNYSITETTAAYSVLDSADGPSGTADAIYNLPSGTTTFSMLWGSPDSYNTIEFLSGSDGGGTTLATFTGSDLSNCCGSGFDVVTFIATGGTIGSVELVNYSTPAFEYSNIDPAPLPAALPLFAGGLALMGLLVWCGKRKGLVALAA
jgi:hypothetical protein